MNLSYALEYSLSSEIFAEAPDAYVDRRRVSKYADNTRFPRFLEVTIQYDTDCFIPVVGLSNTLKCINDVLIDEDSDDRPIKISYPLYVTDTYVNKRTSDSIIQFISKVSRTHRLREIVTSKGLRYYGGQGLIFDKDWNLMMMCGYVINIDRANVAINVKRHECHVSPDVFNKNDILSKTIIKKIIPYISSHRLHISSSIINSDALYNSSISVSGAPVIIEPLKKWVYTTQSPYNIDRLDDDIWSFLNENRNDLV